VDLTVTLSRGDEDQAAQLVRDLTSGRSSLDFPD
jgi:hypothetical protein